MTGLSCSMAIIGDGSVGKSTIIQAFRSNGFVSSSVYKQTVGCDFYEKQLRLRGDIYVSLRVWDIGGQSISSKNLESYLTHSNVIMLIYDVTNKESFDNLSDWLVRVKNFSSSPYIYLLGNKVDLISTRQVTKMQHDLFVVQHGLRGSLFTSAKTGENVVKMFYKVTGEAVGVQLTEYELGFYDQVLTAHIAKSTNLDEVRNPYADKIEQEDLRAMQKRDKRSQMKCSLS